MNTLKAKILHLKRGGLIGLNTYPPTFKDKSQLIQTVLDFLKGEEMEHVRLLKKISATPPR
ncbi:MAG: hypothetical protein DRJ47_08850 [Thermoprotei archaeon]|nr:MAG: hypothetical protein DRJ47_08850 [Thermoprotei archaeon]